MSVVAMKCTSVEEHPNADRLKVYMFEGLSEGEPVKNQVVANLTNVYEVGDVVAVALPGTTLSSFDNLKIEERAVRGVKSSGMALGRVDAELNTVLGDNFIVKGD